MLVSEFQIWIRFLKWVRSDPDPDPPFLEKRIGFGQSQPETEPLNTIEHIIVITVLIIINKELNI